MEAIAIIESLNTLAHPKKQGSRATCDNPVLGDGDECTSLAQNRLRNNERLQMKGPCSLLRTDAWRRRS